jgi:hypothetical protein
MGLPQRTVLDRLNTEWTSGGKTYRGVVLLQFRSTQPAPPGLSYHVIQQGKEDTWFNAAAIPIWAPHPEDAWSSKSFKDLHNSPEQKWPDVVHGLEINETKAKLSPFVQHIFWRTTWCSRAAQGELNKRHEATYVISFELEDPELGKIKDDNDDDMKEKKGKKDDPDKKDASDKKGKDKGKGTFRKRTLRHVKSIFKGH